MAWLIKTAQADPGDDAALTGDVPGITGGTNPLKAPFGEQVGIWSAMNYLAALRYPDFGQAIRNQLVMNPQAGAATRTQNATLPPLGLDKLNMQDPAIDQALSIIGQKKETIRPEMLDDLFKNEQFVANFLPADIEREKQTALGFTPPPSGTTPDAQRWWDNLEARFQVLEDGYRKRQQQVVAPPVPAPVTGSSKAWMIKAAQVPAPPPPMLAPPMPQGQGQGQEQQVQDGGHMALTEQYQSPEELKADLQKLIQAQSDPESYKAMWSAIMDQFDDPSIESAETSDRKAAEEALTNYLQGGVGALDFLWDLLVKNGRATALDNKIVGDVVENNPGMHQEKGASGDGKAAYAGLFLPPQDSGLNTVPGHMEKTAGGGVGGASPGYGAYVMYGPEEKRMCPKLNNMVSTFVCRYHCLDGLAIDDHQVLCGEAIWRGAMMDKFSREYRDANGNWVGGYINKRFEVDYDDGGHPALLKPGQRTPPIHEDAWSLEKRLAEMRKDESGSRGYSDTPGDGPKDLYNFDQHDITKGPKPANLSEKPKDKIAGSDVQLKVASTLLAAQDPHLEKQDPREVMDDDPSAQDLKDAEIKPPKQNKQPWPPKGEEPWAKDASSEQWVMTKEAAKNDKTVSEDKFVRCKEHVKEESPGVNEYAVCTESLGGQPASYHKKKDKKDKKAFNMREHKAAGRGDPLMQPPATNQSVAPGAGIQMPGNVGQVGTMCKSCGAYQPKGTKLGAPCVNCRQPVSPMNHADAAQAAGAIEKVDSLAVTYFAGVYKASASDGRVAFASEVKEAVDRLKGVPIGNTVQGKEADLAKNIQEDMQQSAQLPQAAPAAPAPAPGAPMMPGAKPTPQEVGPKADGTPVVPGQAMAGGGRQDGPHADGRSLDEFLASMAGSGRQDDEHEDMMESMGLGPDPVRRPQ